MKPFENVPLMYLESFMESAHATHVFQELWDELDWVRHDKVPRREYYTSALGHDYTYGQAAYARTYKSQAMHPAIRDLINGLQAVLYHAESGDEFKYDTVFLNGYEDASDHLGWHSDDSPEMDDSYPISIISLGAERDIWFREKPGVERSVDDPVHKLKLGHGSLAVMNRGMQDTHQHRIPKGDRVCGPRISLTFRMYTDPDQQQ